MKEIRVLLADDHALIRGGIRALLEKVPELQIVAEASDGPEALQLIVQHQPDVALIESTISKLNGFEVTARVSKQCPSVHVIVLSTHANEECLRRMMDCGAAGYLTMTASAAELKLAIDTVANGKTHISSSATDLLVDFVRCGAGNGTSKGLTPRQREVLQLIAEGNSTKRIALLLNISVKTVETYRLRLYRKLHVRSRAEIVEYALANHLLAETD